jgi:hypothetical protein
MGRLPALDPAMLVATSYQLDKYIKHTAPTSLHRFNSVFSSPASVSYSTLLVSASSAGYVEVDSQDRVNVVWVASYQTGIALSRGQFVGPTEAVKLVLPYYQSKVHGFPVRVADLIVMLCSQCGAPLPY